MNTASVSAGSRSAPGTGSMRVTWCPSDSSAPATAAPERRETSRSAEGPPNNTTRFNGFAI
jgi:hypothetical protein